MSEQGIPNVGRHLLEFRGERGLSLRALAELCDLSPNTISLIERGETSPSVSTLSRLATALGVPITAFFTEPIAKKEVIVTRSNERARSGSAKVVLESIGYGLEQQACDPFMVTMEAGASSGDKVMIHSGHELVFCVEGSLEYEIDGEKYLLLPGDALLFHADLPHRWRNANKQPVKFLLIMQLIEERHEHIDQHLHP
jgi:transcriptional regulator with XRE-family HTH domain